MIRATVMRTVWNKGTTDYMVKAEGHAGAGKYGSDIVCAAVSCLMQTLANKVEEAARAEVLALGNVAYGDGWIGGIGDTIAAAPFLAEEQLVQTVHNVRQSAANRKALEEAMQAASPRKKNLYEALQETDMDYRPKYSTGDLLQMGFTRQEIEEMRSRIAGTEANDSVDKDTSVGYQLYRRGQDLTAAAQAGLRNEAKTALGIASSAGENLAVAAINPAAVLPVLSAQGAAEAMGQGMEKGDSAGKTIAQGVLKFGAGWAINSVGAADLARTMGSDYAKNTLAGQIADSIRKVSGDSAFAQAHPAIANAISGGIDNAMQAFVETYADTAIDAALGDDAQAEALFEPETFFTALESGLTGGASGALGGAIGTGLARYNDGNASWLGQAEQADYETRAAQVMQQWAQQQARAEERTAEPFQLRSPAEPEPGVEETPVQEQTAVNDDPAVHTPAQNASIAEYKDSVDPKMAEYVDRVRAGETLEPYMVTETSDRMRDAMQQLAGLDKVGNYTMLDVNGVNHITNRHAGGDGSADGTMKNSADVARAAYVLNNFDNAYLATRKAEGYYTSNGKRAPIVIFEKKIDGSHIIVEAVCDTKKSRNFIISEYLAKNGVDEKEIAKALRPPMDAVADPRHTSETLNAVTSAETTVPQQESRVKEESVENTGETVESTQTALAPQSATPTAIPHSVADATSLPGRGESVLSGEPLQETVGLRRQSLTEKQRSVQQELTRWKVSEGAGETISRMVPDSITDLDRYTAAASTLYRLGQMEDVTTFDRALELARGSGAMAPYTDYVLQQPGGEAALRAAWTQGHGELEAGSIDRGMLGGALGEQSTSGEGVTYWKGSERAADDMATQLIRLNAQGTGTDAILKSTLTGPDGTPSERVRGYIDTLMGRIFFSDRNADVFDTILHEDFHWYNSLDREGAAAVMQQALEYLAKEQGFEDVDGMIRGKMADYAAQNLTYYEAAEELVADSWRGIFDSAEDVTRWAQFQREQADRNAGKSGVITKAVNAVKEMLNGIISWAKEVLTRDPENRAALRAARLAQEEKRALQDAYFAHAEKAMDNLRAAKENAAAIEEDGAAKSVRYSLPEMASETEEKKTERQMALTIRPAQPNAERTAKVSGQNWSGLKTQDVYKAIRNILTEFGIRDKTFRMEDLNIEFGYGSNNIRESTNKQANLTQDEYNDFALVQASIEEVLANAVPLEAHTDKKEKPHVEGMIVLASALQDGERIIPVRAELKLYDNRPTALYFAMAETMAQESRDAANKKRTGSEDYDAGIASNIDIPTGSQVPDRKVRQEPLLAQEAAFPGSSDLTILDYYRLVNHDANFTKYFSDEVARRAESTEELRAEQQKLSEEKNALQQERAEWLDSEEVKAIEAKKKALGTFSTKAKEYRESAEYQNYIAKRKDYNSRLAALDERSSELTEQLKAANARMQQRQEAVNNDAQLAYNAKAAEYGGNAEYRRVLAKEQFGTTEDFRRAGYILPDGQMLDFAQHDRARDTDHREILSVFGPAEVKTGTEALNEFLLDGNVRVMAEGPGIDLAQDTAPTAQQLEQIRKMAQQLGGERGQFTLDISTADGRVAASKEYSGRVDADKVVRDIRTYYKTGELAQESEFARFRYQLAEQADREAKQSDQRQASRAIADKAAALDTLTQFFGLTRGVKVSQDSLDGLAVKWTRTNGSKADREKLAREARVLVEYLKADGADMAKAQSMAETLAGEVLDGATYRNSELWDEYPELHKLEYTVNKSGQAKAELVRRYGSWSEAVAEARRHGVTLRQAEGVRDGNPAEQYESIVNDNRAADGTRDGARALWKTAAQQAGVAGALSMESTEWLDVLMNLHDAIKPKMMSRFADDAEYEDTRVELAGRMLGDVLNVPEMTDAQAIFEGILAHNMQVAKAAAGSEEKAAEVEKNLKGIQKGQKRLFREKMYQNQRAANQSEEVQTAQANAKAEQQLNDILETQGVDVTNMGDLNEKLTVLRETYERQWKEEKKRLKAERQEMLDEVRLEMRQLRGENADLARQLKAEQQRADKAEYSLLVQENEIMDWEAENERKRDEFERRQAEKNALAMEKARQQQDEDLAVAKALAEKRVQKAREGRKMDEVKRSIRRNAAALNQLVLRPSPGRYVQQNLVVQAAEVAKLADMTTLNWKAVNQLTVLEDSIRRSMGSKDSPNAMTEDWTQSKVPEMLAELRQSLNGSKEARLAKLHEQLTDAEGLPDSEKAEMLRDRLRVRIRETENRTYLPMTLEQMQMLKAITSSTLHVIRTANKTLSLAKAEEVDKIASGAAQEVQASKGNHPGGVLDGMHNALTKYNLDMLGGERVFRMLGGYAKDGQMEKLAKMLNDGQRRQTEITVNGEKLFANVTGKANLKAMAKFAGPGAELVDIGLTDTKGNSVPLTHAQLCSLAMHLQNKDSMEHLMTGGLTVPDAKLYSKGDIEQAYQKGQTVQLGMLKDADGSPMADTIANAVEKALTEYDRAWIADMKDFFGQYTTNLINETSMQLLGYNRAAVKNYYPIAVDKGALATQIEGLKLDATIEGRGFLKNRVKSSQPILLEECSNVVQRSLRDTAAYAGLAMPIRDVQKVLNSNVETEGGLVNLKNGVLKEQWGADAVNYVNDLLTDLQTTQRKRSNGVSRALGRLRGNYAGAILTLNPGVAIAQAASLPTAGAVLGMDTMAAVVPFVKNMSAKQRAALEAEIDQHGDALLAWRKRGSQRGELASIGRTENLAEKAMDKLPKALTGWINGMDEITVAALWEGSKQYVKNHAGEFADGADKAGSEAYWAAVNQTYQKVIEQTQPNYTVMQRAGIQRNPDEMVKTFTMFTTQRFQNYGILADAVMDYKAQQARDAAQSSEETQAEVKRAGQQLRRAVVSQVAQTTVFALMKIGADFLLHRWDKEQDENGDMTLESLLKRFTDLFTESAAGNFLYGSEVYSLVSNAINGKDYDVISATNISVVNDLAGDVTKWFTEWRKDTSSMDEEQLAAHHDKLRQRTMTLLEDCLEMYGLPYGNGKKVVDAVQGYWNDIENLANGGKFSFNSLPASATGQYDRLFNAYLSGDKAEGQAAVEKLAAMGKEDEAYKQLKTRLVKYDSRVEAAAQAQVDGKDSERVQLTREIISELYTVMGIKTGTKADAAKREAVIDCVTGAVSRKADALLTGSGTSVTDELVEALDSWNAKDVQNEVDRLLRAGKNVTTVKSKITEVCKPEYTAGSDYDREQMDEMLLALVDADGKELYTYKTLNGWVTAAEKAAEQEPEKDPWEGLR